MTSATKEKFICDAINLTSYPISEADKIVVMYSKEKGLMRCVAKGVKKQKSKLGARMDSLVANRLMVSKGRNLNKVCQAESLNTFKDSRKDMDKLFYSVYITELVANFGVEDDPSSGEVYDLLYRALNRIDEANSKKDVLIAVIKFQLKLMLIAGFAIELDSCLCCREQILDEDMYFSVQMGGVICKECNETFKISKKLHFKIRDFLQAMMQFDFAYESSYDKKATEKVCKVCYELLNQYIQSHTSKKLKSIDVIEVLQV